MASAAPDAFISYSREDDKFVDRLEADLRARGFNVWVDRRRLEGSQDWEQEITRAVERYALFIAVLSKPAVQSPNVRFEHELAVRLGKRIVPVLYKVCPIPSALERLQWVDFTDANAYPRALKELTYACQDSTLNLTLDSNTLYDQALALTASNPERAAILFQRILDRDPGYFGGEVANEQKRLEQRLYASRVARLRAQAEQARQRGEYGVEAGALEAIIALGAQDAATYSWAEEYLPIAQQNRALLGPYNVILQRAGSDRDGAAERLRVLWRQAPYFRDPAGIAPALGLSVPMTYEEAKERRAADEAKARNEQEATSKYDALIKLAQSRADSAANLENEKWFTAHNPDQRTGYGPAQIGLFMAACILISLIATLFNQDIGIGVFIVTFLGSFFLWNLHGSRLNDSLAKREAEHIGRLSDIENERQRLMSDAQAQHQQRMAEIAAEHRHALAEIAQRHHQG